MAAVDIRQVLERLSRGEITAEQADAELAESEAHETRPEYSSADFEPEPTERLSDSAAAGEASDTPVAVSALMNGAGHLLVVGASIERPEIHGPASVSIEDDDSGTFAVRGSYADGGELAVPAEADLELDVNGADVTVTNLRGTLRGNFNVGDVTIAGRFDRGASTIKANAGQVVVALVEGSDVRVRLRAACQSMVDPSIIRTGAGEWTIGDGRASLTVQGNLGQLVLRDAKHE